jgi:hypothetical protein
MHQPNTLSVHMYIYVYLHRVGKDALVSMGILPRAKAESSSYKANGQAVLKKLKDGQVRLNLLRERETLYNNF